MNSSRSALAYIVATCAAMISPAGAEQSRVARQLSESRQLLVVTASDWRSASAELRCYQRPDAASKWRMAFSVPQVVLGRTGLGWGIGVHGGSGVNRLVKREGDGKSPAGVFRLIEAFGFAAPTDAKLTRFPYRQLGPDAEAIDDPESRYYNRVVEADTITAKDWRSSEPMRRIVPYRWGAVVGHNWDQVRGAGSCIFLHVWEGPAVPTSGCTAMAEQDMIRVVRWLDLGKRPLLVQLPTDEYRRLQASWSLPVM